MIPNLPVFDKCDDCGKSGTINDSGAALPGRILEEFEGDYLCKICIEKRKDQAHGEVLRDNYNENDKLLGAMGF